jgi:hypothetical protein
MSTTSHIVRLLKSALSKLGQVQSLAFTWSAPNPSHILKFLPTFWYGMSRYFDLPKFWFGKFGSSTNRLYISKLYEC